jgi:antirestriction protein ArdC
MNKVYQIVTDKIMKALDNGTVPWHQPWQKAGLPKNLISGKNYQGINSILLSIKMMSEGYTSPYFLTAKQVEKKGGKILAGQKGKSNLITFWKCNQREYKNKVTGENEKKSIPFLRYYLVFNVEQCEGIDYPKIDTREHNPIDSAQAIIDGMTSKPNFQEQDDSAWYRERDDTINMPKAESFESSEAYYSVYFHELSHSTGHESRVNRELTGHGMSKESYSKEELIAEMSAAFLCAHAGIDNSTIDNSAAYIQGWRKKLSDDPQILIQAASKAQKAANYILNEEKEETE